MSAAAGSTDRGAAIATREPAGGPPVEGIDVSAFTIPTDAPEGDGTLSWDSTTIVVVEARAGGRRGIGYTYGDVSIGALVRSKLAGAVHGRDAHAPRAAWGAMVRAIRNLGRPGICSMAIAAVETALWDLHARLLERPLCSVLGAARESVPVYGSGGFTTYGPERLAAQLGGWVERGIPRVKMKVGASPGDDPERARIARAAIGDRAELFVDANGAYDRKQALELAEMLREQAGVSWLEEPVSSDDLAGLRLIRDRAPAGMAIAAGEYGYDAVYFERMLDAGAVDVLQVDVTRCAGIAELLRAGALCRARGVPLSCHCGPAIHAHPAAAVDCLAHLEYFHDHVRIEELLFDGLPPLRDGALWPDLDRPGNGLELKRADAERYAA